MQSVIEKVEVQIGEFLRGGLFDKLVRDEEVAEELGLMREWERRLGRYKAKVKELVELGERGGKADSEEWLVMSLCRIL